MTGVDIANTIISFETRSDPLTVELWRVDPGGAPEMRVFSLREERADLRQFIQGAVLVGHDLAKQVSLLEYHMGEEFSNERWDVFTLARIFFPGCHERGLNALAQSVYAHVGKSADPLPSSAAGLSWYLLQACWQKGLGFDLSFYAALDPLTSGWAGKGFADALHREVRRRFPDRPLRLDLGLAAPEDGLFQKPDAGKEALPPAEWVAACFAPQGLLEQRIVGFESRAGQQTMVREITEKMTQPNHCVIEAGTGVGKSLAYLIPGIWLAKTTGHKVVVATHTIPLQEQIVKKDLAMLSEALPFTFKSALVKGKSNYLCLRAWLAYLHQARDRSLEERLLALSVLVWLRETRSGDFQELPYGTGYWEVQVETNADVEACNPVKCAHGDVCFFMRARRQANQADLLVANHSLLFADIKAGRAILPEYDYLVVDEAHHLVDTAIEQFGSFISGKRIRAVLDRVNRIKGGSLVHQIRQKARSEQVLAYLVTLPQLAEQAKEQAAELFYLLEDILGKGHTYRFTEHSCGEPWWDSLETQLENLRNRVQQLDQALQRLSDGLAQEEDEDAQGINYDLTGCRGQLSMISEGFPYYLETQDPQRVTWLERSGRQILWRTCPIEVSALLRELLFNQTRSVILTSATLSVAGSFKYLYQDAGLETATQSLQVESPFCYEQQTRLFVVRDVFAADDSLVAGTAVSQAERLAQFLSQLAHILHGKTLVLFTAHQLLRATYDVLGNILDGAGEGIGILAQGIHGDRSAILEEFRHHPRNIILGASSYWEGIDLPGAMLECVVLVKLPFWSPSIPLIEARCDWLKLQNRNAFYDFMLPQAVVRFKQGFGRLIRTKTDRGYVIVLDDRLIKKSYGETFIRSLPTPSYQVGEAGKVLDRIRQFESVRV